MAIINLLNQSAPSKSTDENSANLINMYMCQDQDQGKYQTYATYTPGLTLFSSTAHSPIRAMINYHGTIYGVGNNKFFSVASNGTETDLGTLSTSSGFCKIDAINAQLLIIDGTAGYMYVPATTTFSTITSDTYLSGIDMTAPGNNYTVSNVEILAAVGTGATATTNISNGQIVGTTITNTGTGYTGVIPSIYFTTTNGAGATASVVLNSGVIQSAAVTAGGSGYTNPSVIIIDTTGTGATATCTVVNNAISTITITGGGLGYTAPTFYFFDLGGSGCTATVNTTGAAGAATISSITVNTGGSGYITPIVKIIDTTGIGGNASATNVAGVITAITVNSAGSGYTSPIAVISDSSGGGATANALTTTSTFPSTAADCVCQDEFGIAVGNAVQTWYASNISDLKTWPALSFAATTGNQNNLVAVASLHREIFLLGTSKTEVWYNAGNANFTFTRRTDVYIEMGCAAKRSVVQMDNTLYFLGQNVQGGTFIVMITSYTPQIISTDAINYQISTYSTVSDAYGFAYSQEGHTFYVLTFPTANVTWVYDVKTQQWHQRASSGNYWLPSCFAFCYGKNLVGDSNSGNIYTLDMTNYTENSTAITRTIITHPFYAAGAQVKCSRLQIDMDQTPGATLSNVNLYISRDGGNTFGSAKAAAPTTTQDGQYRTYWTRLGQARAWVMKLVTTMNAKFIVLGAWADFTDGDS